MSATGFQTGGASSIPVAQSMRLVSSVAAGENWAGVASAQLAPFSVGIDIVCTAAEIVLLLTLVRREWPACGHLMARYAHSKTQEI